MASNFPTNSDVELKSRKGHDMTWSCDKHAEPISFYCKEHNIPICHRCATKDHGQKPCQLDDIEDVIFEMRRNLEDKETKIEETKERLKRLVSETHTCETFLSNHIQSVSGEVNATYEGRLKSVKDKEQEKIRLIHEEADEEIRIINEKRDKRIKACNKEAEKLQHIIEEILAKLMSETKAIKDEVERKIENIKSKNQHAIGTIDNMSCKIRRIRQDDETLVTEALHVLASLEESVSGNLHQDLAEYLDLIHCEVQRVKFVEGEVGGKHYARIDGYIGKWERVKSIDIPSIVNRPVISGLISHDKICLKDLRNNDFYVTNINNEHTEKVIEGDSNMNIISCAPIDSNVIVCGKWRGDYSSDGLDVCITLYDRQWKVTRDITLHNTPYSFSTVYVDVDRDGMILAAEYYLSNIYVINPADGKIVNTIRMQGKKVLSGIQALPSGDIALETSDNEFTVISRSGEEKSVIHCGEWVGSWCSVDKLADTLYITYQDEKRRCAVDQVSCDGNIQARRIVEYVKSDRSQYGSPCLVTPSGNLVAFEGDKLFVYKKSFML